VSDFIAWWTTERLMALSSVIGLAIAALTAYLALAAIRQTKNSIVQANRPMMIAEYLPPELAIDDLALRLSNRGKSIAYDVQLTFEPALPAANLEQLNRNADEANTYYYPPMQLAQEVLGRTFPSWIPNQSITTPFWACRRDSDVTEKGATSDEGVPNDQKIVICYRDEDNRSYEDIYVLDPGIWGGTTFMDSEATKQRKAVESLAKSLSQFDSRYFDFSKTFLNRTTSPTPDEIEEANRQNRAVERVREREKKGRIEKEKSKGKNDQ